MSRTAGDLPMAAGAGIDWAALAARHDAAPHEDDAAWLEALETFDQETDCREEALAAEPLLFFRGLRDEESAVDPDAIRHGVRELRRAADVGARVGASVGAEDGLATFERPRRSARFTAAAASLVAVSATAGALFLSPTGPVDKGVTMAAAEPVAFAPISSGSRALDPARFEPQAFDSAVATSGAFEPGRFGTESLGTVVFDSVAFDSVAFDSVAFDSVAFDSAAYDSVALDSAAFVGLAGEVSVDSAPTSLVPPSYGAASSGTALAAFDPRSLPAVEELVDDAPWIQIDDDALTLVIVQADL